MSRLSSRSRWATGREQRRDHAADLLRRRVGRAQLGVLLLDRRSAAGCPGRTPRQRSSASRARGSGTGRRAASRSAPRAAAPASVRLQLLHCTAVSSVLSIISGKIGAASRHQRSASRACFGDAPASPQAGVITTCGAHVAGGSPSCATGPTTPRCQPVSAAAAHRGRTGVSLRAPGTVFPRPGRRQRADQQPRARLRRLGESVQVPAPQLAEVERDARPRQRPGLSRTEGHDRSNASPCNSAWPASTSRSRSRAISSSTGADARQPARRRDRALQARRAARARRPARGGSPGNPLGHLGDVPGGPSASEEARSATRPGSASAAFSECGCSIVAASVHGPASWILSKPAYPSRTSSIASRSEESIDLARRRSRPGRSDPPAARPGQLDGDVDEQPGRAADDVRAGAAVRAARRGTGSLAARRRRSAPPPSGPRRASTRPRSRRLAPTETLAFRPRYRA